jgi:hypothetical protein
MTHLLRKGIAGAVTAASLAAMLVASSVPAAADWRGHRGGWGPRGGGIAAGVIGGLALGALAGAASRSYAAPVYGEPVYPVAPAYGEPVYGDGAYAYESGCRREWRPIYGSNGGYIRDRQVTVCY